LVHHRGTEGTEKSFCLSGDPPSLKLWRDKTEDREVGDQKSEVSKGKKQDKVSGFSVQVSGKKRPEVILLR
jgi:hypothetical protein